MTYEEAIQEFENGADVFIDGWHAFGEKITLQLLGYSDNSVTLNNYTYYNELFECYKQNNNWYIKDDLAYKAKLIQNLFNGKILKNLRNGSLYKFDKNILWTRELNNEEFINDSSDSLVGWTQASNLRAEHFLRDNFEVYNYSKKIITKLPHEFESGEKVLMRNDHYSWGLYTFKEYSTTNLYPFLPMEHSSKKYCIPYKGNEHLKNINTYCNSGAVPEGYILPYKKCSYQDAIMHFINGNKVTIVHSGDEKILSQVGYDSVTLCWNNDCTLYGNMIFRDLKQRNDWKVYTEKL